MEADLEKEVPGQILERVSQYVVGRHDLVRMLTVALLSGGHILVEGLPGTAKTLVARTFAQAIGGQFKRVQLTPDMLPGDITGFNLYRPDGTSHFLPGPLFANIVLADELNRTTPRTQSAFLEAMQEGQVTVEGSTHPLPRPFLVIASQLPYGGEGTYPLSDVQIDRFMLRLWSDYPDREVELQVLARADLLEDPHVEPVTSPEAILKLRERVKGVHVSELVSGYIVDLVDSLRQHKDVLLGPGPRASLAFYRGARTLAFLEGRDFALPDDVRLLAVPVLEHRVKLTAEAELDEVTPHTLVQQALEAVPVPKGAE
ncbi:MAG: AAA family ATPase [Dehalococcoidia bacterium]